MTLYQAAAAMHVIVTESILYRKTQRKVKAKVFLRDELRGLCFLTSTLLDCFVSEEDALGSVQIKSLESC